MLTLKLQVHKAVIITEIAIQNAFLTKDTSEEKGHISIWAFKQCLSVIHDALMTNLQNMISVNSVLISANLNLKKIRALLIDPLQKFINLNVKINFVN